MKPILTALIPALITGLGSYEVTSTSKSTEYNQLIHLMIDSQVEREVTEPDRLREDLEICDAANEMLIDHYRTVGEIVDEVLRSRGIKEN